MPLHEYARKRDFEKTDEPKGKPEKIPHHRFVIQKHAASRLHYDFRLEVGGVLKSWAVPKGIPFARGEKRLAVQVEDHPVSYIDFEGTIPKGQYGGGTVMVWDKGTFSTNGSSPEKELEAGKLHFSLAGNKLHGDWHLVRLRDGHQWLLIKGGNDIKPVSKKQEDISALSGRTIKQLSENGPVWGSPPNNNKKPVKWKEKKVPKAGPLSVKFIEPMKARIVDLPPVSGQWIYEIKFDGYRAIALMNGQAVRLLSRNEKEFTEKFREIADALSSLALGDTIIDGEIVALDADGVSSFQLLQALETGSKRPPIYYYAFDLLRLDGDDLQKKPLAERKAQLAQILKGAPDAIRFSASLGSDAKKLLKKVRQLGLEGLIGKKKGSFYEPGRCSGAWIKLKLRQEQEFVIGGHTNPEGSREHFGALLVGYYRNKKLVFCGKVGTGFNARLLDNLYLRFKKMSLAECPFANLPELRRSRYSPRITTSEMKKCHWIKPELVCQVEFSEWTRDDKLRQPVFLGLREDKDAGDVVREN